MAERTCVVPGCPRNPHRATYCPTHKWRLKHHGTLELPPRQPDPRTACRGGGCTATVNATRSKSGLCKRCYQRQWYVDHRETELAKMAEWREANREFDRKRWADYYTANAKRLREASRAYYEANRDVAVAKAAEWRRENRKEIRRRERERRLNDPNWAPRNRENVRRRQGDLNVIYAEILAEHGMTCHICGDAIESPADLHMDHVIPLSRGGAHSAENIRPAHAICNLRKGARIIA